MRYLNNSNNAKMDRAKHNPQGCEHIEALVEKFLEGRTSNSEERELYDWFATHDVPEEWSELKEMFAWYAAGMPEAAVVEEQSPAPIAPHHLRRSMALRLGGWSVAATVAIVLGIVLWPDAEPTYTPTNVYEGSYVVENGIRNDDIDYIHKDIEAVLARADAMEQRANELLAWADI